MFWENFIKQSLVDGAYKCLYIFGSTLDALISDHEAKFWLLELESQLTRFPQLWLMFEILNS